MLHSNVPNHIRDNASCPTIYYSIKQNVILRSASYSLYSTKMVCFFGLLPPRHRQWYLPRCQILAQRYLVGSQVIKDLFTSSYKVIKQIQEKQIDRIIAMIEDFETSQTSSKRRAQPLFNQNFYVLAPYNFVTPS